MRQNPKTFTLTGVFRTAVIFLLTLPFRIVGGAFRATGQVMFTLVVLILHPQIRWLRRRISQSRLVQKYVSPALAAIFRRFYDPYFAFLRGLSPFWATVGIAVPLAILEPAKLVATIMIAERPRIGIVLWFGLQGLSIILIERTWTAVRPQSRKIWLVSRLHAWGWLMISHGKRWIRASSFYRALLEFKDRAARLWRNLIFRRSRRIAQR